MDSYSLLAWTARITDLALRNPIPTRFMPGSIDQTFVRHLVGLSCLDEGARLAREFLNKHGIHLVVEPQLPNARLDGAAALLPGFVPVIGMTLRHDRLSRFWYCLCHELAHIALHSADDGTSWFVDDLDLRDVTTIEQEADAWTDLALTEQWRPERRRYSTNEVRSIAASLKVHPAIVAGRIRRATSNFRALSQLVGRGLVHRQFTQVNWPPDPRRQRATDRSKGSNPRQRPHPLS